MPIGHPQSLRGQVLTDRVPPDLVVSARKFRACTLAQPGARPVKMNRAGIYPRGSHHLEQFVEVSYGVLLAGLFVLNFSDNAATPAATFSPFCPSIETGCKAIEWLKPPTSTLAPAPTPTAALAVAPA